MAVQIVEAIRERAHTGKKGDGLIVILPMWALIAYVTYRGFAKNEFRERGRWGWFRYKPGSVSWVLATTLNLVFLTAFTDCGYQALFHGSTFSIRRSAERVQPAPSCNLAADEMSAKVCSN